ncbi:MAG: DUF3822 family protein [Bacteroidota bacterium]
MTTELKNKVAQVNSFIDESFDPKKGLEYHLSIQIGTESVWITINEKLKNKYIAFENYKFENVGSYNLMVDVIDLLLKESRLLAYKYKTVACVMVNNLSTIIPTPLFEDSKKKMYLKFNAAIEEEEHLVMVDDLKSLDAKNIFALPLLLKEKFESLYSSVTYHHFSSALMEGLLIQNKNQANKKLFVHIQPANFEAVLIEGKSLLFYNTFKYQTAEDFIYYLLFVCEQLQLNPENIEIILLGDIEKSSEVYSITQKYIRNLKFGERFDNSDYSYQLQTLPKHQYFTLFNGYLIKG